MKKTFTLALSRFLKFFSTYRHLHYSVLILLVLLPLNYASGQTTVFSDDFNRDNGTSPLPNGGTPTMTWTSATTASSPSVYATGVATSPNYVLQINTGATAAAGRSYVTGPLSTFLSPFSSTLSGNTSEVTWTFNMKTTRTTALSGFDAGNNGSAVILAMNGSDPTNISTNGYAVVLLKGTTNNAIKLVRFANGLILNSKVTTIVGPSADLSAMSRYVSVKVVYVPSTNTWSLFYRDDLSTQNLIDPTTGTLTQVGTSIVNSTYTSDAMTNCAFFWNHSTGAGSTNGAMYDNFKVTVNCPVTWVSGWPKAESPIPTGFTAKVKANVAGTSYYVVLAKDATAPSSAQVKAGQDATGAPATASGSIACAAGNTEYVAAAGGSLTNSTDYDVYYVAQDASGNNLQASPLKLTVTTSASLNAPTIQDPTATSITNNSALIGGNITSDGGSTITERGTVWNTTTGVTIDDNKLDETGRTTGVFTHNRTSLPAKSKIYYKAYAINTVNTTLSSESNFYTLADEPTSQVSAFAATASGNTSIDLSWTAASGADGYIILQKQSASASSGIPVDATYYTVGSALGNGTVATYLTSGATTTQTISGLSAGTVYSFKIFSVNSDGVNAGTYNYYTTSPLTASATTPAATYTWNQTGTASWATASNWTPNRTTPDPSDILQFNSGGSIIVTDVPTQTAGQLIVTNNTILELQSTTTSTLTIGGGTGTDLTVATGSALNINQAYGITIVLTTGNTGTISGTMTYNGGPHKLTAVDASAISFKTGATFSAGASFTLNPFGTTGNSSVVFESGSTYIFMAGGNPFGATSPASAVVFQTGSTYVHKATSLPSFGSRTYANFELNEATANITAVTSQPVTIDNLTITSGTLGLGVPNTLTIKGNVSVASGATLNFNPATAGTVSLKGDLNIASGGTLNVSPTVTEMITFSGTGAQSINNAGTFSNNSGASYIVANSVGVNVASNITIPSLTINAGGILNINAGKQLTVSTTMSNSGTLNLLSTSGDVTSTATIITPASITENGGTYSVQQNLISGRNWYVSSPVSAASSDAIATTVNTTTSATTGFGLQNYDEVAGSWASAAGTDMAVTKGYVAKSVGAGNPTLNFTGGTLNTGNKTTQTLTRTSTRGYNLVGNPYPSYVNVRSAINNATNLEKTLWYRTKNTNDAYVFDSYNTESGVGTNANLSGAIVATVPPMQAFWVRVATGTATLTFDNAKRSHKADTVNIAFKARETNTQKLVRLQVSNAMNADETLLCFNDNASDGYDNYDSHKRTNDDTSIPEIYTTEGGEQLVINGMNSIAANIEIALGFNTGSANTFRIKATEVRNFDADTKVILKDNVLHTESDITDGTAYTFSSDVTNTSNRFTVVFRAPGLATNLKNTEKLNAQVFVNAANQITIIAHERSKYAIYNTMGQLIEDGIVNTKHETRSTKFVAGVYFVSISKNGESEIQKVIIR